jgi:hypothetical protein
MNSAGRLGPALYGAVGQAGLVRLLTGAAWLAILFNRAEMTRHYKRRSGPYRRSSPIFDNRAGRGVV